MATLLQKRTVDEVVRRYAAEYGIEESRAFLFLVIEKFFSSAGFESFELNSIDIEASIVDGSDDCGIDAIVIDEESESRPAVYIFQSKYHTAQNSHEKAFPGSEITKLKNATKDFVLREQISSKYQNARLIDRLHSVRNLFVENPRFILVFCSNGKEPHGGARSQLEDFIEDTNATSGAEYFGVQYIDIERLTREFLAPAQSKPIDFKLQTSGKYMTDDSGDVRLFLGAAKGHALAQLVEENGDRLFEKNVRGFLKKSNPINKGIIRSATTDTSPYFVYMNNGVTITCEKYSFSPVDSSPNLSLKNAQIVNGQQTVRSLAQAQKEKILKEDVRVLIRIVETTNADLLPQIVEATNSQTKVTSRDLHSNDEIQRLIESALKQKGYFYEARKNKYQGKKSTSKRVDAEIATQAYVACFKERPAYAKDRKSALFGKDYDDIFSEDVEPLDLLQNFLIFQSVRTLNKMDVHKQKYHFLNDASLHLAALIYRMGGASIAIDDIHTDNKNFIKLYQKSVKATQRLVNERAKKEGEKYENRRTFIDPETYGRLVELVRG